MVFDNILDIIRVITTPNTTAPRTVRVDIIDLNAPAEPAIKMVASAIKVGNAQPYLGQ